MGGTFTRFVGASQVKALVSRAGLPLEVDDDAVSAGIKDPGKPEPLSAYTTTYDERGWFTGVRSEVTIPKSQAVVYASLSKDLHKVFTPMTVCDDTLEEDDGEGAQTLFRVVRIPFRVLFVTGNLKMRLHVEQDSKTGHINFKSVKEGRLIKELVATFEVRPAEGSLESQPQTIVTLDTKISASQLPPSPFKGVVKGVMVKKIDDCMLDLLAFHTDVRPPRRSSIGARSSRAMPADSVTERQSTDRRSTEMTRRKSGLLRAFSSGSRRNRDSTYTGRLL